MTHSFICIDLIEDQSAGTAEQNNKAMDASQHTCILYNIAGLFVHNVVHAPSHR